MDDLAALNLDSRLCLDRRGDVLPIVEMFDELGEPTEKTADARSFVCGPDRRGRYWSGAVADFEPVVLH